MNWKYIIFEYFFKCNPKEIFTAKYNGLLSENPKWDQHLKFTPLSEMTSILAPFIWESPPGFGADKSDYFRKINYLSVLILSGWPLRQRSRFNTLNSHFIWWLWILHLIFSTKERPCQVVLIKEKFHKLVTASYHSMICLMKIMAQSTFYVSYLD